MSEGNDEFASSAKDDAEMMDMVRASAAVEQAALREQELNTRMEEQMAVLLRIANERRGKGKGSVKKGGPNGSLAKDKASNELARLRRGLLPGEFDEAAPRSHAELLRAAATHAADHAAAGSTNRHDHAQVRRDAWGALGAGGDGDDAADEIDLRHDDPDGAADGPGGGGEGPSGDGDGGGGDDDDGGGDDEYAQEIEVQASKRRPVHPISSAQDAFNKECVSKVRNGTAEHFIFIPPCASMRKRASAALFALQMAIVWLPHVLWRALGAPLEPPCPDHGFPAPGETSFVKQHGMAPPRRFTGVTRETSGYIIGSVHTCAKCKAEKDALHGAAKKAKSFSFRSYSAGVLKQYLKHKVFSFIADELDIQITWRQAVTSDFKRLLVSAVSMAGGSNVNAMQLLFSELHEESADRQRKKWLRFQKEFRGLQPALLTSTSDTAQPTLLQPVKPMTMAQAWSSGVCNPEDAAIHSTVPGTKWCRSLVVEEEKATRDYYNRWREQMVSALVLLLDHSCKVLKCMVLKNRLTIMNEIGQVLLAVNVASTSFGDIGALVAFSALREVLAMPGRPPVKLVYIDATNRDGPGVRTAIGIELPLGAHFAPDVDITVVRHDDAGLAAALARVRGASLGARSHKGVIGFDAEWAVTFVKDAGERPVALVQIATPTTCLLVQLVGAKALPQPLLNFLTDNELSFTGCSIGKDFQHLDRSFGHGLHGKVQVLELGELANDVPGITRRTKQWSLADIVDLWLGTKLAKGSVRVSDWEDVPLSEEQIRYAAIDAVASKLCHDAIVPAQRDAPLMPVGIAAAATRAAAAENAAANGTAANGAAAATGGDGASAGASATPADGTAANGAAAATSGAGGAVASSAASASSHDSATAAARAALNTTPAAALAACSGAQKQSLVDACCALVEVFAKESGEGADVLLPDVTFI